MEARAAATPLVPAAGPDAFAPDATGPIETARPRDPASRRPRPVARATTLTRAEEYGYIRSDLNRLLVTATALLALMIVLLVVLEA